MAILGSGKRRLREEAPTSMAWTPPRSRESRKTELRSRLPAQNTGFPVVHISKLKPVRTFPDMPTTRLTGKRSCRVDLDEALLPDDSSTRDLDEDEYEVDSIT